MPSRRIQRLNEQLRREISEVVRWDVKDPRVGPAAISRVETSADLAHARVWVVIVGDDADEKETLAGLAGAATFIRSQLSDRIEIRKVPALQFRVDRSMAHATHIQKLLGDVQPPPPDYDPDWEKQFERADDDDFDEDDFDGGDAAAGDADVEGSSGSNADDGERV